MEELVEAVNVPRKRDRPDHDWIRGGTWKLVAQRAELRKQGLLTQAEGRKLARHISTRSLERALQAAHVVMAALMDGDLRKAYGTLCLCAWHNGVQRRKKDIRIPIRPPFG